MALIYLISKLLLVTARLALWYVRTHANTKFFLQNRADSNRTVTWIGVAGW